MPHAPPAPGATTAFAAPHAASAEVAATTEVAASADVAHPPRHTLGPESFAVVDGQDNARITRLAGALHDAHPDVWHSPAALAEAGAAMAAALPAHLLRAAHRHRGLGNRHQALVVRGLTPAPGLQPTPATLTPPALGRAARQGMLTLLGVMALFGEPFAFAALYEGRLVQHVVPVPGQEEAQTSGGSRAFLDWHVEDAFRPDRCDYLGLLCLRGDPSARTLFSAVGAARLDARTERTLREPRFTVGPDLAHAHARGAVQSVESVAGVGGASAVGPVGAAEQVGPGGAAGPADATALTGPAGAAGPASTAGHGPAPVPDGAAVSVLSGSPSDPELRYDAVYLRPLDPADQEAATALRRLGTALERSAVGHVLIPGDLLVLDNRRAAHARTLFAARGDGTDRWLLRVMTCASPRAHRRRGARHVIA
ncbi:TauD/TfdA family dioxygenase [Streptomyces sp. HSW2009]|uniref:TauD/TfdA family dioxygenase n=1 Tax=Streptomyces sp. HSW2009 TaxID=3142890 RepID=UPI0032EBF1A2